MTQALPWMSLKDAAIEERETKQASERFSELPFEELCYLKRIFQVRPGRSLDLAAPPPLFELCAPFDSQRSNLSFGYVT